MIFDLDETLIHCNEMMDVESDVVLPITFPNGEIIEAGINVRPYLYELLNTLKDIYEIIVFTASHNCYANRVLDYLDPKEEYFHHRLFRDHCIVSEEGIHIKDLRILGNRNLEDIIIVDNACYSFGYQIDNGIPIIPYYDNKKDEEFKHLAGYLKELVNKDIRETNRKTFRLSLYQHFQTIEDLADFLFEEN